MTPEERAYEAMRRHPESIRNDSMFLPKDLRERIAAAIREAVEDALLDASGTLADIAFSADLDLQGVRNKARKCYERINPAGGTR